MRKVLKYIFHNIVCNLLLRCRMDVLLRNVGTNKRLIIMYHGVRKGSNRINGRHITAAQFEKQLQYYKQNFAVVPLDALCATREHGLDPVFHTIALTFDDGFMNNLTVALPLLEKYQIPATFFICSAGLTDPLYGHPTDRVDLIRAASGGSSMAINGVNFFMPVPNSLKGKANHPYQYINGLSFRQWLAVNEEIRNQISDQTAKEYAELYQLIDETAVRKLAGSNLVTIGSHSHHHVNAITLTPEELQYQLSESKKVLESHTPSVSIFAFPYGFYDAETVAKGKEAGYQYLIAAGNIDASIEKEVFPRLGILDGQGFSYAMLMINKAFRKFGF